ncbi:S41 family peptidase [Zobellia barbeyronii]|uniref:Carboxyl-terminal protease n=1 Tax=Zobellia barbeyronii TaxID=2748009 RepID=A0ABS5WCC5_9FLAO|nr:S41 family peptidase [Zobellia barbeyronii]MBT2161058.1 carboxyl-terminal protease [Zobellia barbeyronii]
MKKSVTTGLFLSLFLIFSCSENDDFSIPDTVDPDPDAGVEVQDFMWKAMNFWYFWQSDVENLSDANFPNTPEGSVIYTEFLSSESDPGKFFDDKLLFSEDRFSFFSDDYVELTQSLAGISKSNGLMFGLVRQKANNSELYGYVQYIVPNSNASTKNIKRGDLFTGVNGTTLTDQNYISLLFGDSDSYTLNMASIVGENAEPNGNDIQLTKEVDLRENPIFLDEIIEIQDSKIGYLAYTGFTNEYDEQLNTVFGRFKSSGVNELVLDLRYNPGGSVNTAVLLSSMIYGTNSKDVFLKALYNEKYQKVLDDSDTELRRFFAEKTGKGTAINTLNLKKVYILTTTGTASASELIINGLRPYMDIVQIGETTRGKNEFSVTMVDDRGNNYIYSAERASKINSKNKWAIQPLLGRNENAEGFSNFTSGLLPDEPLQEDITNMGVLGDLKEPYLAKAIELITGSSAKGIQKVELPIETMTSSKMFTPLKDNMYVTDPPIIW